jgi:hypothetical protein
MTNTAYLLLVHHQPRQTAILVRALAHSCSFIYIHVDALADESAFIKAVGEETGSGNVIFIKHRLHGSWGRFSLVEASLLLLKTALAHSTPFDHFVLLSGQDFPVKSITYINRFLSSHKGHDFIEHFSLPSDKICEKQGGLYRVNRYHHIEEKKRSEFPPYSKKPVFNALFNAWANLHHRFIRKMPFNMPPRAGSQWWMLSRETVMEVLSFLNKNKMVEDFFRNVWIPDEVFFQTVIGYLKGNDPLIINKNYRFTKWEEEDTLGFTRSPKVLTIADLELLSQSEDLFARKFEEGKSLDLVHQLLRMHAEEELL